MMSRPRQGDEQLTAALTQHLAQWPGAWSPPVTCMSSAPGSGRQPAGTVGPGVADPATGVVLSVPPAAADAVRCRASTGLAAKR